MDSITHIALGACMGEAFAGKQLGRKAMLWGALAQSIPDIDFMAATWMDTTSNLLAHRGFTHSLLFCTIITPLFALASEKLHRPHKISFKRWLAFFGAVIFIHVFLDAFNSYGVGWFEPFSHQRISFNVIYVADPFFSIWPGLAFVALLLVKRPHRRRRQIWMAGLALSFIYLGYCGVNKIIINRQVTEMFAAQHIRHEKYFTTPAPLQSWLWYVVAASDSGFYIGYHSIFDEKGYASLHYFPKNEQMLDSLKDRPDVHRLLRFSQGYYTVEEWNDTLVFNDLRFGQVLGWQYPKNKFAFYYYLQYPHENLLAVQRGRFTGWNAETFSYFIKRITGNTSLPHMPWPPGAMRLIKQIDDSNQRYEANPKLYLRKP